MNITVYTRSTCGPCKTLKHWLKTKNLAYQEKNIDDDPRLIDEMLSHTNMQIVPLTIVNGEPVSGLNISRLASLLTDML